MGQFARLLPDVGWDVTVLTSHAPASVALDRDGEAAIAERGTRIVRAWSPVSSVIKRGTPVAKTGIAGAVRRALVRTARSVMFPDREVLWVPGAIQAGRSVMRELHHDVVLATYSPASDLIVGKRLAAESRLPLVVDYRDLWSTVPLDLFASPLHRSAANRLERSIVRKASRVIAVAPAMAADLVRAHELAPEDAISITNGFDPADLGRVRDQRDADEPFRLMYTGTVHSHYNVEPFWRSLRALADAGVVTPSSFRVEFVGNLALEEPKRYGVDQFVDVKPFVARDQVFGHLARADALLVVETAGYYARSGYAAKVFDYVLTGKPVVGLVDLGGNTDTLLRAIGVGHTVATDDTAGLERVLREVIAAGRQPPRKIDPDAPPLRDFNRKHLVAALGKLLDDVASSEPRGRW